MNVRLEPKTPAYQAGFFVTFMPIMKNQDHSHHSWVEIDIDADPETHEAISGILFDLGCNGIVSQDQDPRRLRAYLKATETTGLLIKLLKERLEQIPISFPGSRAPFLRARLIENQNWSEKWKQFFKPEKIMQHLTIIPAWETPPPQSTGTFILMDPGPAFGTGQHPTTKMCLMALAEVEKPDPWNMLDVGTGSGILAIYAALLGARPVVAIDIDTEALRWARRNAQLNNVEDQIVFSATPLCQLKERFSVVAANLIYDTIRTLTKELSWIAAPEGSLIVSGLLREQAGQVVADLEQEGLECIRTDTMKEWATAIFKKHRQKRF